VVECEQELIAMNLYFSVREHLNNKKNEPHKRLA